MANDYADTDSGGKWSPGRTKALMAMVAIITAIAIWLVPDDDGQAPPSLPTPPSAPQSSETLPLPSATGTSGSLPLPSATGTSESLPLPPPPGGIATVTNGGDRARAFIYKLRADGAQPDTDVVFAEAERMQGEGNPLDAYLLYRYAARHGQAQAALILGTQADPAYHTAADSYLPDAEPAQAYKWYSMAATAGSKEAALRLLELRKRVQQDAAAGDEQARRLLLQWQ
ncbi:MAG: hypothetical protein WBP44_05090 [Gammaproteobacteria bacterium]|jgi:hypothetical protein